MMADIDVCVCTYRRPQLVETLRSLAALQPVPETKLRVIVADNDETPSARDRVETAARELLLDLIYIHAPARNISIARNACLDAATAPFIAFIDDDEKATTGWLADLWTELQRSRADVVLGPVQAEYSAGSPDWMQRGDFHSTRPVWVKDEIVTGYTCNTLFRRESVQNLRFRPDLGRTGGEDTLFFTELHRRGGKIAYASQAIVTEPVPPQRSSFLWLMKRAFRSGQTHGLVLTERSAGKSLTRARNIAMSLAKIAFCLAAALPAALRRERLAYWMLRGTMHAGVLARLLGKREIEQYG